LYQNGLKSLKTATFKIKPRPVKDFNKIIGHDGKFATIIFEPSCDKIPINKWIDFKIKIKYSKYSNTKNEVLKTGAIDL